MTLRTLHRLQFLAILPLSCVSCDVFVAERSVCMVDADCDDAVFCNGQEVCEAGACVALGPACNDSDLECSFCDEVGRRCSNYECCTSLDCPPALDCNGPTQCINHACVETQHEGCTAEDPCRSQCELAAAECEIRAFEDFPAYDEALTEWQHRAEDRIAQGYDCLLCTGVCDDGTAFLWAPDWPVAKAEFYDSASSAFVALETMTDVGDPICGGVGYWPARVDCLNPVVTHSICGNCLAIEPVWLPQHHWGFLQEHPEQHE